MKTVPIVCVFIKVKHQSDAVTKVNFLAEYRLYFSFLEIISRIYSMDGSRFKKPKID